MDGRWRKGSSQLGLPAWVAGLLLAWVSVAGAQTADCDRLQAALGAAPPDGGGHGQYARAAERQRAEIARTRDYEASVGCGNPAYGGFDDDQPEQCAGIRTRLARMEDNLAAIEARGQQLAQDGGQRARLQAQFDASCAGAASPEPRDTEDRSADLRVAPIDPDDASAVPLGGAIDGDDASAAPAGQAICVRSCDGGYFPLGHTSARAELDGLEELCKASCPNTEAHLYTMGGDGKLDEATSVDGQPYTALPAAHRFEKAFNPSCTCKPPGQNWVQALAEAEKLLEAREGDVTVTPKLSDAMAKPAVPPPQPVAKDKARKRGGALAAPAPLPDVAAASESLRAAQAPTASTASAGIGPAPDARAPVVAMGEGELRRVQGRDGVKRTVRVVGP